MWGARQKGATMEAQVVAIGIVSTDAARELRFVRRDGVWTPDLLVDHQEGTATPPPPCFTPTQEVLDALDSAFHHLALEAMDDPSAWATAS